MNIVTGGNRRGREHWRVWAIQQVLESDKEKRTRGMRM